MTPTFLETLLAPVFRDVLIVTLLVIYIGLYRLMWKVSAFFIPTDSRLRKDKCRRGRDQLVYSSGPYGPGNKR